MILLYGRGGRPWRTDREVILTKKLVAETGFWYAEGHPANYTHATLADFGLTLQDIDPNWTPSAEDLVLDSLNINRPGGFPSIPPGAQLLQPGDNATFSPCMIAWTTMEQQEGQVDPYTYLFVHHYCISKLIDDEFGSISPILTSLSLLSLLLFGGAAGGAAMLSNLQRRQSALWKTTPK